jgi:hypothetical protein
MILDEVVCADLVPPAASMVLIIGQHLPSFEAQMAERKSKLLRIDWPFPAAIPAGVFDFVLLPPCDDTAVDELVTTALKLLDRHGALGLVTKVAVDNAEPPVALLKSATSHGLLVTRSRMCEEEGRTQWAFTLLRSDYDPVAHAADLERSGFPMRAFIVLESIAELVDLSEESQATLSVERHRLLHDALLKKAPDDSAAALFSRARKEFYLAVHIYPRLQVPYLRHAALWRHFGRHDLAGRLLRSIGHVTDAPNALALLQDLDADPGPTQEFESVPLWSGSKRKPRILVITHDNSDYGMDSLYDGLCAVLGAENIVEFPWKPTLHGDRPETALNYPCVFDYPGEPRSEAQFEQELRNGRFDFILFADVVEFARKDTVRRLLDAAGDIPVVVYDTWDDPHSLLPGALGYLGRSNVSAYFKREMLTGFDYGENSFPLPFGYPDRLVPESVCWDRSQDLFWAGKRIFGTRALYLDRLSQRLGRDMDRAYSQEEYRHVIGGARIGLSLFGFGYDTVRYWELPAHGVMLLAERPPIRIPHNFVDGESAVFFDDLPELEEKLDYYLAHPDDAQVIAQAGREHFLRHHTSSMRAKQFLGRLETLIEW